MGIKETLKKSPLVMKTYNGYRGLLNNIKKINTERVFKKNHHEAIIAVQNALDSFGRLYFLDMGTLLGIYRDGRLITGDSDIDVGIKIEDEKDMKELQSFLKSQKFRHILSFSTDKYGLIQDTYSYKGVRIDINYYRTIGEKDYCYLLYLDNRIVEMWSHRIDNTMEMSFEGIRVKVPADTEQHLKDRYGENWRIPDPHYIYWEGPSAKKVEGRGRSVKCSGLFKRI